MSGQTKGVDVLAVIADAATWVGPDAKALKSARAAVAELIEAGEEFAFCDSLDAQKRFKAALARVRGGA